MSTSLPRFFIDQPAAVGECVTLQSEEAHHARVRRISRGDRVALFDGRGRSYVGCIEQATSKQLEVRIEQELAPGSNESPLQLTLAIALLKSDRFEWLIEKTTELGVTHILPFTSEHSLAQRSAAKQARWLAIALSAAKQCGRSIVPQISAPSDLASIIAAHAARSILFWEGASEPAAAPAHRTEPTTLIIGPEGGFADVEVDRARRAGCTIASLGSRILRAETAAIAAVTLAQAQWGDLTMVPGPRVPG